MRHHNKPPELLESRQADPLPVPGPLSTTDDWLPPTDTTGPRPLDVAQQALVEAHMSLAYRLAWRYARVAFRDCPTDELVAEAAFALTYAAALFDPARMVPFELYAAMVIRHRLIHVGNQWRRASFGHTSTECAPPVADPYTTEPDASDTHALCRRVRATLPRRWYDMLWLHCTEGLTLEEIGARLGVSKQRAQKIIAKAMHRVRSQIDGWGSVC